MKRRAFRGKRTAREPPRHNSNFIAGPDAGMRAPRRRRRIYGQFFLLIFITSTCERGSATKRASRFPRVFSQPLAFLPSELRRLGLSLRCTWNSILSSPSRDPYHVKLHGLCPEEDCADFFRKLAE